MKVLVVKIGAVGDTVMALSLLDAVFQKEPDSQITWVCGETVAPLIRASGRVSRLVVVDDRKLLRGGAFGALAVLLPLWLRLFAKKFDLIVTGHSDRRYGLLSLTAISPVRRSFGKGRGGPVPGRYHGDEYVRLVTGLDGPTATKAVGPVLRPSLSDGLKQKLQPGKKTIALAPGGAKNLLRDDALRRWPLENYSELARKLCQEGFQVLLTGSPSDDWVREAFKALPVTDLVGQTSLLDLIALYSRCDLVITHDSGPLHLALASGTIVLALFGPTLPSEKTPQDARVHVIWGGEKLACRPCYDGKGYADCANNLCLQEVTVERVVREVAVISGEN